MGICWSEARHSPASFQTPAASFQKVVFQVRGRRLQTYSTGIWVHCKSIIKPNRTLKQYHITTFIILPCSQPHVYRCPLSSVTLYLRNMASYHLRWYSFAVHCVRSQQGRERQCLRNHFLDFLGSMKMDIWSSLFWVNFWRTCSHWQFSLLVLLSTPWPLALIPLTEELDYRALGQALNLRVAKPVS